MQRLRPDGETLSTQASHTSPGSGRQRARRPAAEYLDRSCGSIHMRRAQGGEYEEGQRVSSKKGSAPLLWSAIVSRWQLGVSGEDRQLILGLQRSATHRFGPTIQSGRHDCSSRQPTSFALDSRHPAATPSSRGAHRQQCAGQWTSPRPHVGTRLITALGGSGDGRLDDRQRTQRSISEPRTTRRRSSLQLSGAADD